MITKCNCQQCGFGFSFDANDLKETSTKGSRTFGQIVPCPHCSRETRVYVDGAFSKLIESASRILGTMLFIGLLCVGILLILNGMTTKIDNAIQQIYCALHYTTGFIVASLALILNALSRSKR